MKEGGMFMTNEKFIGFTMEKTKHIALVAHDHCKDMLMKWVERGQVGIFVFAGLLLLAIGIWYLRHKRNIKLRLLRLRRRKNK